MSRKVELIVIHCSDSNKKEHDDIGVINDWHAKRGFLRKRIPAAALNKSHKSIGYQFFIKTDGTIQVGRDIEEIGAHCEGFNSSSIGICLHGKNELDFTEAQFRSCRELCVKYMDLYKLEPKDIVGHCSLNKNKLCPVFSVEEKIIKGLYN